MGLKALKKLNQFLLPHLNPTIPLPILTHPDLSRDPLLHSLHMRNHTYAFAGFILEFFKGVDG